MFQGEELVPRKAFFTSGVGVHKEKLTSFEMALRDARVARHNLVRVSSIFPTGSRSSSGTRGSGCSGPARWSSAS